MALPPHRVLVDESTLVARVDELASEIANELPDASPLVVGLLRGSFVFVADLARGLSRRGVDPQVDFAWPQSYVADGVPSDLRMLADLPTSARGRAVLLVDDIVESGATLLAVKRRIEADSPSWLRTCALLDKPSPSRVDVPLDHVGFRMDARWVFGYGLDTSGFGRALPYLADRTE